MGLRSLSFFGSNYVGVHALGGGATSGGRRWARVGSACMAGLRGRWAGVQDEATVGLVIVWPWAGWPLRVAAVAEGVGRCIPAWAARVPLATLVVTDQGVSLLCAGWPPASSFKEDMMEVYPCCARGGRGCTRTTQSGAIGCIPACAGWPGFFAPALPTCLVYPCVRGVARPVRYVWPPRIRVYPCVRGVVLRLRRELLLIAGVSLRARGGLGSVAAVGVREGCIPAGAGALRRVYFPNFGRWVNPCWCGGTRDRKSWQCLRKVNPCWCGGDVCWTLLGQS